MSDRDRASDRDSDRDGAGLVIGGWSRLSTCDWPGRLVTTVFTQGCPWRCGYCHNRELLDARAPGSVRWRRVLEHLERRRGLLDGVVFSGGEPLLQPGLGAAMRQVRRLGFGVGLHTGGAFPRRLGHLVDAGLLDWVGFDIKSAPGAYDRITATANSAAPALRSLALVRAGGVAVQTRTTIDPDLLDAGDLARLRHWLSQQRLNGHVWQQARPVTETG
ncbi:anaerobic ribonucleoside-triphosphate reductase activating protein [Kineosporia sp. J2-2]|uniref:Anaerobic ribonucleoside-triphosphate reductase activating protein n=1 Tax=Kineosporia corallincola TaxID=2835133 RepID=A0ABS5TBC8_9ACTN|nr:anaerobic ribonucleoside-triphosphate reductase activating protein [Kineosporia corallincola]MBT0768351.1 anaerobic ribonucleoside-triphosphate reductase activating protein [Kineosporia corallincola]